MSYLNKHERRLLKHQQKEGERRQEEEKAKKSKNKKYFVYVGILLVVIIGGYGVFSFLGSSYTGNTISTINTPPSSSIYPSTPIHWHATLAISACGQEKSIPRPVPGQFIGTHLLHTHEDGRIHIEGVVTNPADITLGKFFDAIGIKFSETSIFEYDNGYECNNGKENKVSMTVNGVENQEFRNYVLKDGDNIVIRYE